jgi:hypothetical protein
MLAGLPFGFLLRLETLARREIGLPWLRRPH